MMFGLTKREQRWAAEQKAAETLVPLFIAAIKEKEKMDVDRYLRNNLDDTDYAEASEELEAPYKRIAALEIELLTAIARMRTAIHMLDAGNTKGQVRLWLDGYCNTAPTEK